MEGIVYVKGSVLVLERQEILISGGALVAEGTVYLSPGAVLEIRHSAATRALPGLLALKGGALTVSEQARLRVHGLVLATRTIGINVSGQVDVVGAVLAGDVGFSFRNSGGTVVIRYDQAVLGTPALHASERGGMIAWIASWEELPKSLVS